MTKQDIAKIFREKGRTLSSAESFTGGLFASEMVSVPGASHFFKGAMVTYFTEEKVRILGLNFNELDQYGVVSYQTAISMAKQARIKMASDYAVSFTGNAGPDVMENKPAGEIYIGIASYNEVTAYKFNLKGTRDEVRHAALEKAYELLFEKILEKN